MNIARRSLVGLALVTASISAGVLLGAVLALATAELALRAQSEVVAIPVLNNWAFWILFRGLPLLGFLVAMVLVVLPSYERIPKGLTIGVLGCILTIVSTMSLNFLSQH